MDRPEKSPDIDKTDPARSKKIAALKKAVTDGTYHVPAERLADKLIDHMLDPKG
jgi:anti-sigma28 factor (negative regulator of flagellin synthesis)